ncbi:hypothetical protein [Streptomyces alboflavus]|uniref:hypothetical protein n=1 Tax=Streptomyces alboflavus TaxID=67267 RepID=UPI00369A6FB4
MVTPPDPGPWEPRTIYPLLDALATCLCTTLAEIGRPVHPECGCCVVGGDAPPPRLFCDPGQAWVRDVAGTVAAPSQGFGRCVVGPQTATVELGVYRCAPTADGDGNLPSCEELRAYAKGQALDKAALISTVACCEVLKGRQATVEEIRPVSATAGCGGIWLRFSVRWS